MNLFAAFNTDGYKQLHGQMYATGTELVYNNLTPRSDKIYRRTATKYYDGKLVLVGVQGAFMEIVEGWDKFFKMDKAVAIAQFKFLTDNYVGKDVITTDQLSKLHDLGYLPLEVRTLEEGTKVPMGVPVLTVRNTVDHAYWLCNFLETVISSLTWKPSTCATIAAEYKAMLTDFAVKTGTPLETVLFQAHDFSARGMSGPEDSARSGFGHLSSFLGTDTCGSIIYAQQYYGAGAFVAATVPATEHAVSTSNILRIEQELAEGRYEFKTSEQFEIAISMTMDDQDPRLVAEIMFMYELILKFPTGILSYVADSFDFYGLITRGLPYMVDVIRRRESNGVTPGKLVIRPDSGDPVEVICGQEIHKFKYDITNQAYLEDMCAEIGRQYAELYDTSGEEIEFLAQCVDGHIYNVTGLTNREYDGSMHFEYHDIEIAELTPEQKGAVQILGEIFGIHETSTGHTMLDGCIGLIYGDSITTQRCLNILERLESKGYASGNCVFGIGSYTYQCITRDTFGMAVKATFTRVNGVDVAIFKDPKTDSKKKSAKGLLYVERDDQSGDYKLIDDVSERTEQCVSNELKVRFYNGKFFNLTTLDKIRALL